MITEAVKKSSIVIGRLGENEARVIRFHVGGMLRDFPGCSFAVLNRRPNDRDAYPVSSSHYTVDGEYLLWTVGSGDLTQEGLGECEIIASVGSKIVKSEIYSTKVLHALDGAGTPPEPWESWVQDVEGAADRAESAAALLEHPGAEATTLDPDESATASYSEGTFTFGIPKGADGQDGRDGTDGKDGADGKDGKDGADGKDGQDGQPGQDGFSPIATVSKSGSTATISITDSNGTTTAQVSDGQNGQDGQDGAPGQDGHSPVITTSKSGKTTTILSDGESIGTVLDGNDGQDGSPGVGVPVGGTQGQMLVKKTGTDYDTEWANQPSVPVQDVQANGTSVVNNGVANFPIASLNGTGLAKIGSGTGITTNSYGELTTNRANDTAIKGGSETAKVIVPNNQHTSVFYGLAKASGDTSQSSSSNAVGTYTEDAKSKISDMLNAPVSVSGSTPSITAKAGIRYICGECSTLSVTLPSSGDVEIIFESGSTATVLTLTPPSGVTSVKFPTWFNASSLDANCTYDMIITDGKYGVVTSWA